MIVDYANKNEIDLIFIRTIGQSDLSGLLMGITTEGQIWRKNNITRRQVMERMQPVFDGASLLWDLVNLLINDAVQKKYLAE